MIVSSRPPKRAESARHREPQRDEAMQLFLPKRDAIRLNRHCDFG
jgi:hypothetical protein